MEDITQGVVVVMSIAGFVCFVLVVFSCALHCFQQACPDYCEERRARRTNRAALSVCRNVNFGASGTTLVLNECCPICIEDFVLREKIVQCPCNHGYHRECLQHWLSVHSECPICKAAVVSSTQEHCSERETTSLIM
ncbi:hypothetical protein EMCRGX_G028857 [Ephydatia muelleri]